MNTTENINIFSSVSASLLELSEKTNAKLHLSYINLVFALKITCEYIKQYDAKEIKSYMCRLSVSTQQVFSRSDLGHVTSAKK